MTHNFDKYLNEIDESLTWCFKHMGEFLINSEWHRKISEIYRNASICLSRLKLVSEKTPKEVLDDIEQTCQYHISTYRRYFIQLSQEFEES